MPDEIVELNIVPPPLANDDIVEAPLDPWQERRRLLAEARRIQKELQEELVAENKRVVARVAVLERKALKVRRKRTQAHLELLDIVKLLPVMSRRRKKAILIDRFGIEAAEARRLLKDAEAPLSDEFRDLMLQNAVSPATIEGLMGATKTIRDLAIADMSAGYAVSKAGLTRIKTDLARGTRKAERSSRNRYISRTMGDLARTHLEAFKSDLREYVAHLCAFHALSEESEVLDRHHDEAVRVGSELKLRFDEIFDLPNIRDIAAYEEAGHFIPGDVDRDPLLFAVSEDDKKLAAALQALTLFSRGKFVRDFMQDEDVDWYIEAGLISDLAWLADFDLSEFEQKLDRVRRWNDEQRNMDKDIYPPAPREPRELTCLEICAGAGGQAIGLHRVGFNALGLFERDRRAVETLRQNANFGPIFEGDVRAVDFSGYRDKIDLFAGGVPCQPFSSAGNRLGEDDERDLFDTAVSIIKEVRPRAIMLENVSHFDTKPVMLYRAQIISELTEAGYDVKLYHTSAEDYGLGQVRSRIVLVGFRDGKMRQFTPPPIFPEWATTVGEALFDLMAAEEWEGAAAWAARANRSSPTIVGASEKSGGQGFASKFQFRAWNRLGIDAKALADEPPNAFTPIDATPRLTHAMGARLQGFPENWIFQGPKGQRRRQIANAFPPIVAAAWGLAIKEVLEDNRVFGEMDEAQINDRNERFKEVLMRLHPTKKMTVGWKKHDLLEYAAKWNVPVGTALPDVEKIKIVKFWEDEKPDVEKSEADQPQVEVSSKNAELENPIEVL